LCVERDAESVLFHAADNATTEAGEDSLENSADAVRATAQNREDDVRANDPNTNLSNRI
jgi:hypothetical protein